MTDVVAGQTHVLAAVIATSQEVNLSNAYVLAAAQRPAESISISNYRTDGAIVNEGDVKASALHVLAAVRGRIDDPKIRAWTYTLDGHDYYILRLGNEETLVYDVHSQEWFTWGSFDSNLWKAFQGTNWIGAGALSSTQGSNIVVGDDAIGVLYFLNPDQYTDDDVNLGADNPREFTRLLTGQMFKRGYSSNSIYRVELLGSIGKMNNTALTEITLSGSDDQGETYTSYGTISIPNGSIEDRVDWRSLGSVSAPGRLFRIEDQGALVRIDSLTAYDDSIEEG